MTQNDIIALINEIQTAADYPATKMNPLLNNILSAAYGPMYIGSVPPGNTNDENAGYRPGSVGYDTITERFYICQSALSGNASWVLVPSDAKFTTINYKASFDVVSTDVNVSVVKTTNNNISNILCGIKLPPNPFIGKTVLVYFVDAINQFTVKDSSGVNVVGANSLTIPAGQQYIFSYSGTAWEIVGVNNTTAGSPSGVDVSDSGGTVTTNTTNLTFLGTGATVADDGIGGTNITINPLAGVDVTRGATTITAAQEISLSSSFSVTSGGAGVASVGYVSKIGIEQDGTLLTGPGSTIGSFDFKGSMFAENPVVLSGSTAEITLNGTKTWVGTGNSIPSASNDITQGYSTGSIGRNTGNLLRTYVCRVNSIGAAIWDQITLDYKTQQFNITNLGTYVLDYNTAFVRLLANGPIASVTLTATPYPYDGKTITVYASNTGSSTINGITLSTLSGNVSATTTTAVKVSVTFVCINAAANQWILMGNSFV